VLDFHNHLIPQVDDGSQSIAASASGIATMREQGIRNIITTPHLRASKLVSAADHSEYFKLVDAKWAILSAYASEHFPDIRLERGFEILLDAPDPDLTDPRTRLARTQFVLVEFPFVSVPPNSARALFDLRMRGYEPIVAHPERYADAQKELKLIEEWIHVGAHLQVNAGSLLGKYGPDATRTASLILARGWASYISSDYHATGSCDSGEAYKTLRSRTADEAAELLFTVNPERILSGELPLPVPAVAASGATWGDRLRSALRLPRRGQ
jgi:protein-tyrosine phosphatase